MPRGGVSVGRPGPATVTYIHRLKMDETGEQARQKVKLAEVNQQVRIQDLVRGGPQVLRPKIADVAKRSCASKASNLRPGSRARLRALEAFGFLMLKYAFSHILETLFL